MAHVVMNKFKYQSALGEVDLSSNTLKLALINSTFNTSSVDQLSDIAAFSGDIQSRFEISGTGYTANGVTLTGVAVVQDDVQNSMVLTGNDITWTTASFTAYGAFIYRVSDSLVDFGAAKTSTAGDFTIEWNSSEILHLA
jgi:hypothetical protein